MKKHKKKEINIPNKRELVDKMKEQLESEFGINKSNKNYIGSVEKKLNKMN